METTTLVCNCGETKELAYKVSSSGDVYMAGWGVCPTFDSQLLNTCPTCYEELKRLSKRIFEITGNEYVSISHLID